MAAKMPIPIVQLHGWTLQSQSRQKFNICRAICRIPWDNLLLRAPPQERLAEIEMALGELEFRQHAQRFTRLWAAMRSAEQAAAAAGVS